MMNKLYKTSWHYFVWLFLMGNCEATRDRLQEQNAIDSNNTIIAKQVAYKVRTPVPTDIDFLSMLFQNSDVMRYFDDGHSLTSEAATKRATFYIQSWKKKETRGFVLTTQKNVTLGYMALAGGYKEGEAEFFLMIHPNFQGKGIGSTAIEWLVKKASTLPEIQTIYASTWFQNPSVWILLQKNGFQPFLPKDLTDTEEAWYKSGGKEDISQEKTLEKFKLRECITFLDESGEAILKKTKDFEQEILSLFSSQIFYEVSIGNRLYGLSRCGETEEKAHLKLHWFYTVPHPSHT